MAYRLPSDRKDRPAEHHTPSYLSDFLDHIQNLPSAVKTSLTTIRTLDDRIAATLQEANTAAAETIRRATNKQPLDALKRQYHDFIHLQATVSEFADNKLTTANEALTNLDAVVTHLDAKLAQFEKQLRKEGRWPGANPHVDKPPVTPALDLPPLPLRPQKRRREAPVSSPPLPNPATPRAAALAARVEAAAAAAALAKKEDEVMVDAVDAATVDTTLYCLCKNISHGQMVGCEGKNCVIEWFHFECVGLTEEPKGTWYCPDCRKKNASSRRKLQ